MVEKSTFLKHICCFSGSGCSEAQRGGGPANEADGANSTARPGKRENQSQGPERTGRSTKSSMCPHSALLTCQLHHFHICLSNDSKEHHFNIFEYLYGDNLLDSWHRKKIGVLESWIFAWICRKSPLYFCVNLLRYNDTMCPSGGSSEGRSSPQ